MVEHGGSRGGRSPGWSVSRLDVALAASAAVLGTVDQLVAPHRGVLHGRWPAVLVTLAVSALLLLRRRHPLGVALVVIGGHALTQTLWPFAVALYTVASEQRGQRLVPAAAVAAAVVAVEPLRISPEAFRPAVVSSLVAFVGGPVLFGAYVRTRRDLVASLVERAARLEREQQLLTRQALFEERSRIAREMHDVVGHRMSLVVLHAGALAMVTDRGQEKVAEVAELVRDSAQKALEELRLTVATLRRRSLESPVAGPPTTVSDIERLVAQSRATGLPVSLRVDGDRCHLTGAVERAAYRVVQEALTNVHKHAPGARTSVVVRFLPGTVEVLVINEGPPRPAGEQRPRFPRGGHGLAGLRERALLLGGQLHAGPLPLGGFRVLAVFPAVQLGHGPAEKSS